MESSAVYVPLHVAFKLKLPTVILGSKGEEEELL